MKRDVLFVAIAWTLATSSLLAVPVIACAADHGQHDGGSTQTTTPQDQNATTPAKGKKASQSKQPATLGTITVTATRRVESVDKIPVAVTALGGEALRMSGIQDTQSLPMVAPSLYISSSTSEGYGTVIRLRGIGTTGQNSGIEPAVGVFVDGVYRVNSGLALQDLYDIQRVEVVKGPQSTLYGKNTSAGVINILTNAPTFTPEAHVDVSLGNYNSRVFTGVLSGPASKTLAFRLSAHYNHRDGYVDDIVSGQDYNNRNRWSVRAQALWKPSDDFSLRIIADADRKVEACCAAPFVVYGPKAATLTALGAHLPPAPSYDQVALDAPTQANLAMSGISATLNWNLHWATAKAVFSDRHAQTLQVADGDRTDIPILYNPGLSNRFRSRIADLSLQGTAGRLDWLAGFYYSNETITFDNNQTLGADAGAFLLGVLPPAVPRPFYPAGTGSSAHSYQSGHSSSVYTNDVIHFDHGIDLTLGARFVRDMKSGYGYATSDVPSCTIPTFPEKAKVLCAVPRYDADYRDSRTVGTISLSKTVGRGIAYASYSTGIKAGGINLSPGAGLGDDPVFKPETVKNYEVGLKLPSMARRFDLRTDLFVANYEDLQLNTFNGQNFVISNAASATTKGLEVEGDWLLAPGYKLSGSYMYDLATYGQDAVDPTLRGQQLTNAPRNTVSLSFNVNRPIGPNILFGNLTARYQSEINTGSAEDPNFMQGSYTLVNARIGLHFQNGWSTSLWADNLTDRHYYIVIFKTTAEAGNYSGFPGLPRTFGVELRKDFF